MSILPSYSKIIDETGNNTQHSSWTIWWCGLRDKNYAKISSTLHFKDEVHNFITWLFIKCGSEWWVSGWECCYWVVWRMTTEQGEQQFVELTNNKTSPRPCPSSPRWRNSSMESFRLITSRQHTPRYQVTTQIEIEWQPHKSSALRYPCR